MFYDTRKEAVYAWVSTFNAIPRSIIKKLMKLDCDEVREITPPSAGDYVHIEYGEHRGEGGEILHYNRDEEQYEIKLDGGDETITLAADDFEVERDGVLPTWGTMWSFGDSRDDWWLEERNGLQVMADCGFRVYEQEDYGYIFGIDGYGYDFYEAHWIPLYRARGLKWSEEDREEAKEG